MARGLNIERRRKRIRHYAARRRRRSPFRRAITYWWGAALLLSVTLIFLAQLTLRFHFVRPGQRTPESYRLPKASLQLCYVPATAITDRLRMSNARRIAVAMHDADIGLSLDVPLPKPTPFKPKSFAPLSVQATAMSSETSSVVALLPRLSTPAKTVATGRIEYRISEDLKTAKFTITEIPKVPTDAGQGRADFWVTLDARGRVNSALRVSPSGEETAWYRTLRTVLCAGSGAGAAQGLVTLYWTAEGTL